MGLYLLRSRVWDEVVGAYILVSGDEFGDVDGGAWA